MRDLAVGIDRRLHDGLREVGGFDHPVLASREIDAARVRSLAERSSRAHSHLREVLGHDAPFALLVLGPNDWESRSMHPLYGMPNYQGGNLIVAGTAAAFWRGFVDLIEQEAPEHAPTVADVYANSAGKPDLTTFFDLLAIHELMHVFLEDRGVLVPRMWLAELICNLALHSYVVAREPDQLDALAAMPTAIASLDAGRFAFRSLPEFDAHYGTGMDPVNYGWYQCRFHRAAAAIHDAGGDAAVRGLWDLLDNGDDHGLTAEDAELEDVLAAAAHPSITAWLRTW